MRLDRIFFFIWNLKFLYIMLYLFFILIVVEVGWYLNVNILFLFLVVFLFRILWVIFVIIIEIKDKCDIVYGDFEFCVRRDILFDFKEVFCLDGNFMWFLVKRFFYDEELVGRNFFGWKGRLVIFLRRRNCLKFVFFEYCGLNYVDFIKVVNSINNGIRLLW